MPAERKIVPLFPEVDEDDAPVKARPPEPKACRHRHVELDPDARRVYCRDCEQEVPAFDALMMFSGEGFDRWKQTREHLQRDVQRLRGQLEQAERDERNTKARARNAKKRLEDLEARSDRLEAELRSFD